MGIRLILSSNRELMHFIINGKTILYTDRRWQKFIQCLPQDPEFIKKIQASRNALPSFLIKMFTFKEEEMKEYENAKDEEELAKIVIRDGALKGARLLSRANVKVTLPGQGGTNAS